MGRFERVGELDAELEDPIRRQRASPDELSAEAARASRWKRSTARGSRDSSSERNFSATVRPSRESSAR